jgi:hypothetical protein
MATYQSLGSQRCRLLDRGRRGVCDRLPTLPGTLNRAPRSASAFCQISSLYKIHAALLAISVVAMRRRRPIARFSSFRVDARARPRPALGARLLHLADSTAAQYAGAMPFRFSIKSLLGGMVYCAVAAAASTARVALRCNSLARDVFGVCLCRAACVLRALRAPGAGSGLCCRQRLLRHLLNCGLREHANVASCGCTVHAEASNSICPTGSAPARHISPTYGSIRRPFGVDSAQSPNLFRADS